MHACMHAYMLTYIHSYTYNLVARSLVVKCSPSSPELNEQKAVCVRVWGLGSGTELTKCKIPQKKYSLSVFKGFPGQTLDPLLMIFLTRP